MTQIPPAHVNNTPRVAHPQRLPTIAKPHTDYDDIDITGIASTTVEQYGSYLRRELPPLIRRKLEALMDGEVEEKLQREIIQTMQALQSQLHQGFRDAYLAPETGQHPEDAPSSKAAGKLPDDQAASGPSELAVSLTHQADTVTDHTLFQLDEFILAASLDLDDSSNFTMDFGFGSDSGYGSRGAVDPDCDIPEFGFDFHDG